jgi:DNA polymerase III alpha subunit
MVGVKNGLKDVARVLDLPFAESNELTKSFDDGVT